MLIELRCQGTVQYKEVRPTTKVEQVYNSLFKNQQFMKCLPQIDLDPDIKRDYLNGLLELPVAQHISKMRQLKEFVKISIVPENKPEPKRVFCSDI